MSDDAQRNEIAQAMAEAHVAEAVRLGVVYPAAISPHLLRFYAAAVLPLVRMAEERARAEERDRIRVAIEALAQHLVPIGVLIDGEQGETLMVRRSRVLDAVGSGDAECPACLDGKRTMTTAGIPPKRLPRPVCGKPDATNEKETDHA